MDSKIKDISIYFELPDIQPSQHSYLPDNIKKFSWCNKIGFAMIKYIDLEIGGILISRHYGDWLNIVYETQYSNDEGWDKNVGRNVTILTEYTNGKASYKLYIPLSNSYEGHTNLSLLGCFCAHSHIFVNPSYKCVLCSNPNISIDF